MRDEMTKWMARFQNYSEGWTVYGRDEHGEYTVAENIGCYADDEETEAEAEREANLIAAAPDLYEALAALLAKTEQHVFSTECQAERDAARAALSRAQGSSNVG